MASRCHHALKKPVFDTLHTVHIHDIHTRARVCVHYILLCESQTLRFYFRDVFAKRRFSISLSLFLSLFILSSRNRYPRSQHLFLIVSPFLVFLPFYPSICFSLLLYDSFSQVMFPDEPREQIWSTSENLKKKHSKKHSSLARHRK